jgi:hypothetical protein
MSSSADRVRLCRRRQAAGLGILCVEANTDELPGCLVRDGLLDPALQDDRTEVTRALERLISGYITASIGE